MSIGTRIFLILPSGFPACALVVVPAQRAFVAGDDGDFPDADLTPHNPERG